VEIRQAPSPNDANNARRKRTARMALLAAALWKFFLGSPYLIGNTVPYMQSYFKDATLTGVQTIFSLVLFCSVFGNFPGTYFLKYRILHPKLVVLLSGTIAIGGPFLASFLT